MYSRGMSYSDILAHFEELYGLELSKGQISTITDNAFRLYGQRLLSGKIEL
jgi:transposase-like protein